MSDEANKGGRPRNVNEKDLSEAVESLRHEIRDAISGLPSGSVVGARQPLGRGLFFLHLMTSMAAQMGQAAFNPMFLDSLRNNADDFYEAYIQVAQGTQKVESTTVQLLAEQQARRADIERERDELLARVRELEAEQASFAVAPTGEED